MRRILIGMMAIGFSFSAFAQMGYYEDVLTFGQTNQFGSTARMQGIAGAQTALGGDLSSAGANPAGLGFYNRSVFSFTPSLNFQNTDAGYSDRQDLSYKFNFNLPNIGIVLNHSMGDLSGSKFKGGSFAISATRVNSFNQVFQYNGYSPNTSIVDYYAEAAGNTISQDLPESIYGSYETYLIDPVYDSNDQLIAYVPNVGYEPYQSETVTSSGGQNQLNFAWGGNYDDFLYFGFGLGVQSVNYNRTRYYRETEFLLYADNGDVYDDDAISSLVLNEDFSINGMGINASMGVIVRPVRVLTLGLSYVTPTHFALTDEQSHDLTANWNGTFNDSDGQPLYSIDYRSAITTSDYTLKTPGRLNVGAAGFIGKYGFISADVEFLDYKDALLQSNTTGLDMYEDNQEILRSYQSVVNYRLGAELRLDMIRFRGGFSQMGNPNVQSNVGDRQYYTFGVGFYQKDYFLDLSVVKMKGEQLYSPYFVGSGEYPVVNVNNDNTSISATLGFNF